MANVNAISRWWKALTGTALTDPDKASARSDIGAVADDDSRLADARTPTSHAASHATGGADEITPAAIGAAPDTVIGDHIGPVTIGATATEAWDVANGHSAKVTMTSSAKLITISNINDDEELSLTVIGAATTGALTIGYTGPGSVIGSIDTTGLTTGDYCIIGIKRAGSVLLVQQSPTISN